MRKPLILGILTAAMVVGLAMFVAPARTDTDRQVAATAWEYAMVSEFGRGLWLHRPGVDYLEVGSWRELHAELAGKSATVSKVDPAELADYKNLTFGLLGVEGWELVTIQPHAYHQGSPSHFVYYFKRQVD